MKKFLLVIIVLFSVNVFAQDDLYVSAVLEMVNADSLMTYVKELSGVNQVTIGGSSYTIVSRHKNSTTNNVAANYLKQKMESYGLTVFDQNFSTTGRNVYAVQTGLLYPEQKYIICAHYDNMPSGSIAPGADDNASGCAAVIEAARILSNFNTAYTIEYVFFDEEEQGLIGSAYFANLARNNNEQILGVFNADMIAWDNNNDGKINIHTKTTANSVFLANSMVSINTGYSIGLNSQVYNPGSSASDHASFWNKNYSAILLIEDYYGNDFNAYYHTVNDKINYFNIPFFTKCSKLIIGTLTSFSKILSSIPVELISFNSSVNSNGVQLEWITATEINNSGFEVEKSSDGVNWVKLGFVNGFGTSSELHNYTYIDKRPYEGNNFYRLIQKDFSGESKIYGPITVNFTPIYSYKLSQNYPNPFNPFTNITYQIPISGKVTLKVYDILGNTITTLVDEYKERGEYTVQFNGNELTSGIYIYRLETENYSDSKKLMLLK